MEDKIVNKIEIDFIFCCGKNHHHELGNKEF